MRDPRGMCSVWVHEQNFLLQSLIVVSLHMELRAVTLDNNGVDGICMLMRLIWDIIKRWRCSTIIALGLFLFERKWIHFQNLCRLTSEYRVGFNFIKVQQIHAVRIKGQIELTLRFSCPIPLVVIQRFQFGYGCALLISGSDVDRVKDLWSTVNWWHQVFRYEEMQQSITLPDRFELLNEMICRGSESGAPL